MIQPPGLTINTLFAQLIYFPHLIWTPVPYGGDRHSQEHPWPGKVRGHRIPENVEGILTRDPAGGVWDSNGGNGIAVANKNGLQAPNLHKTFP